jgi:hypothetical protein
MLAASMAVAAGCQGRVIEPGSGATTSSGSGGSGPPSQDCTTTLPTDPALVVAPQRLVRLTSQEIGNSLNSLFGATTGGAIAAMFTSVIPPAGSLSTAFPPLDANSEGTTIIPSQWQSLDQIASATGQYVNTNFAAVTGCASATDSCAQTWLNSLAQAAYKHPLSSDEMTRFTALYTNFKNLGAGVQEATQYTVYAILSAPQFLYRSELGDSSKATAQGVPLTPYELASELSFFLTENPPDAMLLSAAANGSLTNPSTFLTHVNRILATQPAKDNLTNIMFIYYKLSLLDFAAVSADKYPEFTTGLSNAMYTEAQMFLGQVLWNGQLTDLLTSKNTFVNTDLANIIYKIPVPAMATQSNFVAATLGPTRSGIITNAAFITQGARADSANSIVPHGLKIKSTFLCVPTPSPPANLQDLIAMAKAMLPNQTAVQQIQYRANTPACAACHGHFDQYGLLLEGFDMIGRDRTVDDLGQPVVTATTLPPELGSVMVQNAVDFSNVMSTNPGFVNCLTQSVMQYAMVDVNQNPVQLDGCAVQGVASKFNSASNKTFTELVRDVATATPMFMRVKTN